MRSNRSLWRAVGAGALAASLVGLLLWRSHSLQTVDPGMPAFVQQPRGDTRESEVVRRSLDLTKPLAQFEADLELVDAEIAELRSKAALLDAQRVVEELLARH